MRLHNLKEEGAVGFRFNDDVPITTENARRNIRSRSPFPFPWESDFVRHVFIEHDQLDMRSGEVGRNDSSLETTIPRGKMHICKSIGVIRTVDQRDGEH
jgi:hypothetical protein